MNMMFKDTGGIENGDLQTTAIKPKPGLPSVFVTF